MNGEIKNLHEGITLSKNKKHTIEVLIDRIQISSKITQRLTESVELALKVANGVTIIEKVSGDIHLYSEKQYCPKCDVSFDEINPQNFSFNSPTGACTNCNGLGTLVSVDPNKMIPDINKKPC